MFSWSPPWAPDGVQLNYTVTVTNTKTSEVTVFTTSDTNIILTRDNITSVNSSSSPSSSSQCDQYVWCVTAVNPAGISGPANYTTAVSLIPSTIVLLCSIMHVYTCIVYVSHISVYITMHVLIYNLHHSLMCFQLALFLCYSIFSSNTWFICCW